MALPRTKSGRVLGRLPAVVPPQLEDLGAYLTTPLPGAPASVAVPGVAAWGLDGNSQYGDCTIAGTAHAIAAWDALVGGSDPVPTDAQVVAQYCALTGCVTAGDAHDTGLVISDLLHTWQTSGLFPSVNHLAGYAPVNIASLSEMQQAVAAYGALNCGVNLPQSAENQFNPAGGGTWTYEGDAPIGGHCVIVVGYGSDLVAVTWGATVSITWEWWEHYGAEAWVMLPQAFVEAGKGPEVNLAQLQADLGSLDAALKPPAPRKKHWWPW